MTGQKKKQLSIKELEYPLAGLTFLIVDGTSTSRQALKHLLNELEVNSNDICEVSSGAEALQHLKSKRFDVVVTDLCLQDMTGYDILTCVRQSSEYKNIPVIMLTEDPNQDDIAKATELGVSTCISKPLDPNNIGTYINEALRTTYSGHPSRKATEDGLHISVGRECLKSATSAEEYDDTADIQNYLPNSPEFTT
jgi:two-component system, chemotaxis family, chemotaxis protein CheY